MNSNLLLDIWKQAADEATAAVAKERELRLQVIDTFTDIDAFPSETASGTESIDIGFGFDLKIEHKLDYKVDTADDAAKTKIALDKIEREVEAGGLLAERLVKWKPEISISEYKKLPAQAKVIIDTVLTIKPASKAIKIHKRGK